VGNPRRRASGGGRPPERAARLAAAPGIDAVKMKTFLFDDQGEQWDAASHRLAGELCASISGAELASYAIRNLGYVSVRENKGSLRVCLRPAAVSPITLSALLYWLHDRAVDRILVSYLDGGWMHEMFGSCRDAVSRLLSLCAREENGRSGEFLRRTCDLGELSTSSPLRGLLDIWTDTFGSDDRERLWRITRQALKGRYALLEVPERSSQIVFREVGPGFLSLNDDWRARSSGLRLEDQPDYSYGKWLTSTYHDAALSGRPTLEDVDAIVSKPGGDRRRVRYKRLLLFARQKADALSVLSASVIDDSIDLRVKAL
jgi:hypothetical protein